MYKASPAHITECPDELKSQDIFFLQPCDGEKVFIARTGEDTPKIKYSFINKEGQKVVIENRIFTDLHGKFFAFGPGVCRRLLALTRSYDAWTDKQVMPEVVVFSITKFIRPASGTPESRDWNDYDITVLKDISPVDLIKLKKDGDGLKKALEKAKEKMRNKEWEEIPF